MGRRCGHVLLCEDGRAAEKAMAESSGAESWGTMQGGWGFQARWMGSMVFLDVLWKLWQMDERMRRRWGGDEFDFLRLWGFSVVEGWLSVGWGGDSVGSRLSGISFIAENWGKLGRELAMVGNGGREGGRGRILRRCCLWRGGPAG